MEKTFELDYFPTVHSRQPTSKRLCIPGEKKKSMESTCLNIISALCRTHLDIIHKSGFQVLLSRAKPARLLGWKADLQMIAYAQITTIKPSQRVISHDLNK